MRKVSEERVKELLEKFENKKITFEEIIELLEMMDDKQWKIFVNRVIAGVIGIMIEIDKAKAEIEEIKRKV